MRAIDVAAEEIERLYAENERLQEENRVLDELMEQIDRLQEENRVLDEKLAQSEFALGGFRREALLRRSIKIRQVSCTNGVVVVDMKDEGGHLYRYRAPAEVTIPYFETSHLNPVFEQPEDMGGGYVTSWEERPTPESKPLWYESPIGEEIELLQNEAERPAEPWQAWADGERGEEE